jgi:hypothetical protein
MVAPVTRGLTYNQIGQKYSSTRQQDPRITAVLDGALGNALCVANIGAGTGAYEPVDRTVIAIEPSETMIRQRPRGAPQADRRNVSAFASVELAELRSGLGKLRRDLATGDWSTRYRGLLSRAELDIGYWLVVCHLDSRADYPGQLREA